MQNRSKGPYGLTYTPHILPDDFPIDIFRHIQTDRPITWLHRHDCLELGYCFAGSGIFMVQDKIMPFKAGDATAISQEEMHLARSMEGTTSLWGFIMVDPGKLLVQTGNQEYEFIETACLAGPQFKNLLDHTEHPEICRDIFSLITDLEQKSLGYQSLTRGLMWNIMVKLHRLAPQKKTLDNLKKGSPISRVTPALSYMAQHYMERWRVSALAGQCSLSEPQFRRLFTRSTGRSPQEYLMQLRIRMAMALLSGTDKQIADIALEVGYETLSSFNRNFGRVIGLAPREWRKKNR
jgi:AraC-like DNA-binding protein